MTAEFVVSVVCGTVLAVVVLVLRHLAAEARIKREASAAGEGWTKALDEMKGRIRSLEMERLGSRR